MRDQEDQYEVLYEVRQVVQANTYVVLDTETTSLSGQIIQWAVCDPDGAILGQGYVKPTEPITEGARAIHHISDEMLADKPTFDVIAEQIWQLLEGKTVIAYNADFDMSRLCTSCAPYQDWENSECPWRKRVHWLSYGLDKRCAMEWFATIYGEVHEYYHSYTWQNLETACAYYDIPVEGAHDAAHDARMTALLIKKMAEEAEEVLPEGYHPAQKEPCAGGCGEMSSFEYQWDEDHTWYCNECGLREGIYHLCPECEEQGKRTVVFDWENPPFHATPPGTLCFDCLYKQNMASGAWHNCRVCTRLVKASMAEQALCERCAKIQERHPYPIRKHNVLASKKHKIEERDGSYQCTACKKTWDHMPVVTLYDCPGVPFYSGWVHVPEGLYTMSQLIRKFKVYTNWDEPIGCVEVSVWRKRYTHPLYALADCQPIPRKSRAKKVQAVS